MKQLITLLSIAVATIILATSCDETPSHLQSVPSDALAVMVACPQEYNKEIQKETLEYLKTDEEFNQGIEAFKEEMPNTGELLEKMLDNPENLGLSIYSESYVFVCFKKDMDIAGGAVMSLNNAENFKNNISKLLQDINKHMVPLEIEEKEGYFVIDFEFGSITWNNNTVVVVGNYPAEKGIELLNQSKENSILTVADFNDFYKNRLDFNIWANSNIDEIKVVETFINKDLHNNYVHLHMGWNNEIGEFTTILKLRINEELRNMSPEEVEGIMKNAGLMDKLNPKPKYNEDEMEKLEEHLEGLDTDIDVDINIDIE